MSGVLPMAANTEGLTLEASEGRTIGQQQRCRLFHSKMDRFARGGNLSWPEIKQARAPSRGTRAGLTLHRLPPKAEKWCGRFVLSARRCLKSGKDWFCFVKQPIGKYLSISPEAMPGAIVWKLWEWRFSTLGMPSRTSYATRITRINCIGSNGPKASARLERTAPPGKRFHPLLGSAKPFSGALASRVDLFSRNAFSVSFSTRDAIRARGGSSQGRTPCRSRRDCRFLFGFVLSGRRNRLGRTGERETSPQAKLSPLPGVAGFPELVAALSWRHSSHARCRQRRLRKRPAMRIKTAN